jgi:DNA-binding MarR family transcriptional regulator
MKSVGDPLARTVITKGLVFDGTGTPPQAAEVTLDDDRVVSVTPGHRDHHGRDHHGRDHHGRDHHGRDHHGRDDHEADRVMRLLVRRPGLSVNDVAREFGLQPSNASTAIRQLIARGTLERQQDAADARVARLYPTPTAYAARDRRERSWGGALSVVLDDLAPADRRRLAEAAPALRRLATGLAGEGSAGTS